MDYLDEDPKKQQKDLFYKQQQQRLQNITIKKDVSADDLIRNILEKVDSDAKISKLNITQHRNTQTASSSSRPLENIVQTDSQSINGLPIPQCFFMSRDLPSIYLHVWNAVMQRDVTDLRDVCDRDKLYQVLLLSNLSSNVLAQLWAFVNRTIPGQITKNELFVMLALIGLIQNNYPDPLKEIYKITFIPLPNFAPLTQSESNPFIENDRAYPTKSSDLQSPCNILETNLVEPISNHDDDFADFKSADTFDKVESTKSTTNNDQHELPNHKEVILEETTISDQIVKIISIDELSQLTEVNSNSQLQVADVDQPCSTESQNMPQILTEKISNNILLNQDNDKYSSLRRLTTNLGDSEEFGDFFSHATLQNDCDNPTEDDIESSSNLKDSDELNVQTISNKRKVLSACKQVLQKTFNILIVNHGQESVMEALNSKDGASFALDLNEVFTMAQRIKANLNILNNASEADQCKCLFEEIAKKWNLIFNTIRKSSINLDVEKSDQMSEPLVDPNATNHHCSICSDLCYQSNNLLFAGFRYHISCANFWLNFVNSSLPHRHYEDF